VVVEGHWDDRCLHMLRLACSTPPSGTGLFLTKQTRRGRAHSLGRARDARLGNRGCVALIRLTITPAAYAVIVATQLASVGFEQNSAPNGEFYVWLEPKYVDRLRAMRKPGES
jgi:hypothetical protein